MFPASDPKRSFSRALATIIRVFVRSLHRRVSREQKVRAGSFIIKASRPATVNTSCHSRGGARVVARYTPTRSPTITSISLFLRAVWSAVVTTMATSTSTVRRTRMRARYSYFSRAIFPLANSRGSTRAWVSV